VIENRAHDVSSFGLASIRILERTKPLLHRDRFDLGYVIASPTGQNPLSEIAYVGDLRLPRFGAVRPQLFFPVVFDKRLNTDRGQAGSRILSVDVCPKCGNSFLSRRLGNPREQSNGRTQPPPLWRCGSIDPSRDFPLYV
jgi:hypothetical protein